MQIEQEKQGKKLILKLSGRLETNTAWKLQKVVEEELGDIQELIMDMDRLEYISSAGLRVLLAASKRMEEKTGRMTLYHVKENVMEVFEITGFKDILDIRQTDENALA